MRENLAPYKTLGNTLKGLRENRRESIMEVSGAVEINERELERIESGQERPSEDVLLLLISYFNIDEDKASDLWRLAGYDKAQNTDDQYQAARNTMMVMIDPRIMYSDNVEVVAGPQGIVLNFAQNNGPQNQPLTVARIGMSRDQAKMVMGVLHQALYELDNPHNRRQLPPA